MSGSVTTLINEAATGTSSGTVQTNKPQLSFHAYGKTTAGTGEATIVIEVSDIESPSADADWITAATITLTLGTTRVSDGCAVNARWANVRARLSAVSGTGATVTVLMGS